MDGQKDCHRRRRRKPRVKVFGQGREDFVEEETQVESVSRGTATEGTRSVKGLPEMPGSLHLAPEL